ncbi:hypothetical protein [Caballeronia pedi]|uniref:hypothetical protein n=1 Tax=Caballeronia pedi TaxID=1777141 RepID=UPI0007725366|nr:hypothetical protein [Caballeronia pedi]
MGNKGDEAVAVARIAEASREVQAASKTVEEHFDKSTDEASRTLALVRLTAAINELQAGRDALDALIARKSMH